MWWTTMRSRLAGLLSRLGPHRPGPEPRRQDRDRPTRTRLRVSMPGRAPMRVVHDEAIVHERSSLRARVVQRAARLVFKPVLQHVPITDRTLATMRSLDRLSARGPRSRFVEPVVHELGGVRVESMNHRYGPTSEMTVLYLHGGAFISCGIETHRRICERLALYTGATVISVDYVQLPEGSVSESVADAINAYTALLEVAKDPERIVVAGDSAGGYLTMKIAELARRRGLTEPAALLTFSPLLSMDPDDEAKGVQRVTRVRDAYIPVRKLARIRERWLPEGSQVEGEISMLDAAEHIGSPTFFVAVEDEMLRPEVEAMALLLVEHGVPVETHLWRGQVHAFPVLADAMPESKEAIRLAADFARRAVGELDEPAVGAPAAAGTHTEELEGEIVAEEAG